MDPVTGLVTAEALRSLRALTDTSTSTETDKTETAEDGQGSKFDAMMRAILSPSAGENLSEEELFAALVQQRITTLKGEEAGKAYADMLEKKKAEIIKPDGFIPMEEAATKALNAMVKSGGLTEAEHEKIYNESFQAAQLDENKEFLFDNRGGPGDPTTAVAAMESALIAARAIVDKYDSGEQTAEEAPHSGEWLGGNQGASGASTSEPAVAGEAGFLFKPESDSSGKLVVLLPSAMTHEIETVLLKDENDKILEEGQYSGIGNGEREHYRFNRAGGDYGHNITVEVRMKNGEIKSYEIADPSQRVE